MVDKIDLVVPYVDSSDPNWQELFKQNNPHKNEEGVDALNRFRGMGDFFKYWFRCVNKNMPWINNIYLIVQSDSQVPKWINRDTVHIVYHKDIIPEEFLPTFNSTTIEMFVHNIKGLSEHFLYANDDIFVVRPLQPSNFYTDDDKIHVATRPMRDLWSMYSNHCLNGYCLVNNLNKNYYRSVNSWLPCLKHSIRGYKKSLNQQCFNIYKEDIYKGITPFREECNHNMYLFDYFTIKRGQQAAGMVTGNCINSFCDNKYIDDTLNSKCFDMLAFQDTSDEINIYDNNIIKSYFIVKYRTKCKYEL